jgi:SAM-dependent MidA family methyltransferase
MVSLHIQRVITMSEEIVKIASALERIADALEKKWHIDIDHGHIESIDNIEHGDVDVHNHTF